MKTLAKLILVVGLLTLFVACDEAGTSSGSPGPAQVRFYNQSGDTMYYNIGTQIDETTADLIGSWVSAANGEYSSSQNIAAGTYRFYWDSTSDHSTFSSLGDQEWVFEADTGYLVTVGPSTYTVSEE